ncbi:MAG: dTDP-4-dehydrorhamnose 3,5-epimerase [Ramlibacter sp.]
MKASPTALPEVLLLEPRVFGDERGFFFESWNQGVFDRLLGQEVRFVQDNHSRSARGVLRGLHYQRTQPQGKLVRLTSGRVFDVAVDLRRSSPRFGQWSGVELDASDHRQLWIPPGFGHGFLVLSDSADVVYKVTGHQVPEDERAVAWNDPTLAIAWPLHRLDGPPTLSARDAAAPRLASADLFD